MIEGTSTIIPQQILQLRQIFGINTSMPNSIALLSSDRIFYVAGYHGVLFNPKQKQKSQSYFSGAQGCRNISSITVSLNKKLMAMGFHSQQRPCICYYELNASPKRRKLQLSENISFTAWVSVSFSSSIQTKHLASLTNKNALGQSYLVFWNPQRGKSEAQLTIPAQLSFHQVQFNPNSESMTVSLLGQKSMKFYELKQITEQKTGIIIQQLAQNIDPSLTKQCILKSHTYLLASQHIVVLTDSQTYIIDYKGRLFATINIIAQCVTNWGDGFLLARDGGSAICYYRFQDQKYVKKFQHEVAEKQNRVVNIDANEEKVIILLSSSVMLGGRLKYEPTKQQYKFSLQPVNLHFHSGPIVGMDVCVRKPLIATASKDKTIKIWNYEDRTVQTPKSEAESASCLSFHPSGFHLAVAYSDKLRILNLQKDGESVSNFKDINSFRNCTFVKFSNGGQYFAAASGNVVHVFKFYTGENPPGMTFSGHSGKIRGMAWSKQDNILVTCGADGIIMAYRVGMENCGSKLLYLHSTKQPRTKGLIYSSICINYDNTIYAMGIMGGSNERVFKQVKLDGTDNKRQLIMNNSSQITFPSTGRILFCGTDDKDNYSGTIKCYKFPNTQHMQQFQAHDNYGVQKICVTHDDKYLISAGRDGCLMIFQIRDKEARSDKIKQILPISNQILITKTDLTAIETDIETLKQQKNQLDGIGSGGPIKDQGLKQLKQKFTSEESQFNQKYGQILEKKKLWRKKFDEQIRTKKEEFQNGLQQYDSNQAKNVMQESAKYDQLKRAQQLQSKSFQAEIKRYTQENEKDLKKLEEDFKQQIKAEHDQKVNILRKIQRLQKEHEQTMRQIQEQKNEEIKKISNDHAQQHQNITQTTLRANSDVSITNKKIQEKEQQRETKVDQQKENKREIERLQKANQTLQKQIQNQAYVIQERDKTIDSNQRKIYELKKKSQQLQKFKYVLDHKIKQLKKDIAPRQTQIAKMKAKTNQMDKQLKQLNSLNTGLAEFVAMLFKNEQSLKSKIAAQRARISYQNNKIKQFKDSVHQTAQLIQNQQELKKSVSELHSEFVSQSMTQVKIDSQIEHQYKNQKKYLQKSIAMLKKNLQKDADIHKHQNIRIMKENVDLIKQISSLRLQIREDSNKKGSDQKSKGKNEPKQQDIIQEIEQKQKKIDFMKKQIQDLEERIANT